VPTRNGAPSVSEHNFTEAQNAWVLDEGIFTLVARKDR
jgi:hypothetical protein